jgi:D-serine deaminase-like pyridoxal phosphate-dependent protein
LFASRPIDSLRLVTRRSALRASDRDREQVADQLRDAATEGRLSPDELEDRLGVALSARTYGQLHSAMSDLPAVRSGGPPIPLWARASLAVAGAVGVVAAAAMAAMLFALVACLSAAWMIVSRAMSGRTERAPGGSLPRGRSGLPRRGRPSLLP